MHRYGVRIQRTLRACPVLFDMHDDVILRPVSRRCLGIALLVLERIVEYRLPGRVAPLDLLLGRSVEVVPVGIVLRLPVGILLYGVVVLGAGGEDTGGKQETAQTENACGMAEKGFCFLCHIRIACKKGPRGQVETVN